MMSLAHHKYSTISINFSINLPFVTYNVYSDVSHLGDISNSGGVSLNM